MTDETTIEVYNQKVNDYQAMIETLEEGEALTLFMAATTKGGYVMDLGCGPGKSSAFLQKRGFLVDPVDASPAMVELANKNFDISARLSSFNDVCAIETYDGVWANFSLLHASADDFPVVLKSLYTALKSKGTLHIGMKTGEGASRDALGRLYTFYSQAELEQHLQNAGFQVESIRTGIDRGLAGTLDPWVTMLGTKSV